MKNWLIGKDPDAGKRPWCWERLKAGREGDDRGWNGWMASLTQWTWVWASSGSWWWTGKPGVHKSMGHKELDTTEWLNNNHLLGKASFQKITKIRPKLWCTHQQNWTKLWWVWSLSRKKALARINKHNPQQALGHSIEEGLRYRPWADYSEVGNR